MKRIESITTVPFVDYPPRRFALNPKMLSIKNHIAIVIQANVMD